LIFPSVISPLNSNCQWAASVCLKSHGPYFFFGLFCIMASGCWSCPLFLPTTLMPISINSINASIHGFTPQSAPVTPYEMGQNGQKQSKRRQKRNVERKSRTNRNGRQQTMQIVWVPPSECVSVSVSASVAVAVSVSPYMHVVRICICNCGFRSGFLFTFLLHVKYLKYLRTTLECIHSPLVAKNEMRDFNVLAVHFVFMHFTISCFRCSPTNAWPGHNALARGHSLGWSTRSKRTREDSAGCAPSVSFGQWSAPECLSGL